MDVNNSQLQNNIDFLQHSNGIFAKKLMNIDLKNKSEYQLIRAKKEGYTLKVNDLFFHSKIAPLKEAEKISEKEDYSKKDLIIVVGLGLGYLLMDVFKKYLDKSILVIEKDWNILKLAFTYTDFSKLFNASKLEIMVPEKPEYIYDFLKIYKTKKIGIIFNRPSYEIYNEYYVGVKEVVLKYISSQKVNTATLNRFEKLWFKNLTLNMASYIYSPGVKELFDKFQGKAVFLIGAGPSLQKQVEVLKSNQNNYILIAVNTSFPYLLQNGIIPDFVVVVDPQDKIFKYFLPVIRQKLEKYPILIAEPTISPKIAKNYPGTVLFCDVGFLKNWVNKFSDEKGELKMGGSVITAAYTLAKTMKAEPIVFLGTDMAYSENSLHFRGAELEKEWLFSQNKLITQEANQYNFLKKIHLTPHKGFYDNTVYTDIKFQTYITWLEKHFKQDSNLNIINATEGGIKFEHIRHDSLENVLKDYSGYKKEININLISEDYEKNSNFFLKEIDILIEKLPELRTLSDKAYNLSNKLIKQYKNKKKLSNVLLKELDLIDEKLASFESTEIIGLSIQKVISQISEGFDHQLSEEERNSDELKALKYSSVLYEGIRDSADFSILQLLKSKQYVEIKRRSI